VELLGHHLRGHAEQSAAEFQEMRTQMKETQLQIREVTENVKRTESLIRLNDVQIKANTENIAELASISARLVVSVEAHDRRITELKGPPDSQRVG
jgi:chromosome segregation ATPase